MKPRFIFHFLGNEMSCYDENDELFDSDNDGYEHAPDIQVSHATNVNDLLKQKHIALTADASDSDDDDYSNDDEYPSDANYHRFPLETIKNDIPPQEYQYISEALTFLIGPAPTDDENEHMNGRCHQKKSYKIMISVPPDVFPPVPHLVALQWRRNPDLYRKFIIPTFSYYVLLYLGTISRIVRAYQPAFISTSKRWWQRIQPSKTTQKLYFDVQFTEITTKKLKNIPFRIYAHLQVSSNTSQGQFRFLAQGCSDAFAIYSHSRQYGYTPSTHCPLCNKRKENVISVIPEGFKKKDGSRKFYRSKEHRYPAWVRENHGSARNNTRKRRRCLDEDVSEEENVGDRRKTSTGGQLKVLAVFPIEVLPGNDMSICVNGMTDDVEELFFCLDGENSPVEFTRLNSNSNSFVGKSPVVFSDESEETKKRFYIRKIGYSPYEEDLFDVPESENSYFLYQTIEDLIRNFDLSDKVFPWKSQPPPLFPSSLLSPSEESLRNCFDEKLC